MRYWNGHKFVDYVEPEYQDRWADRATFDVSDTPAESFVVLSTIPDRPLEIVYGQQADEITDWDAEWVALFQADESIRELR